MKKSHDFTRVVFGLAGFSLIICLAGCGISFGGFQMGGREELTFSCGEELPPVSEEASVEKASAAEEQPESGQQAPLAQEETQTAPSPPEKSSQPSAEPGITAEGRVNINTAGLEELMTLNGIGETRAKAIIEYRSEKGSFTKAEDIMQIPGIKEGIYRKIQDQIIV